MVVSIRKKMWEKKPNYLVNPNSQLPTPISADSDVKENRVTWVQDAIKGLEELGGSFLAISEAVKGAL